MVGKLKQSHVFFGHHLCFYLNSMKNATVYSVLIVFFMCEQDPQIADILATAGNVITITIMPSYIHEHMMKR